VIGSAPHPPVGAVFPRAIPHYVACPLTVVHHRPALSRLDGERLGVAVARLMYWGHYAIFEGDTGAPPAIARGAPVLCGTSLPISGWVPRDPSLEVDGSGP
jgi:hypothetical protein